MSNRRRDREQPRDDEERKFGGVVPPKPLLSTEYLIDPELVRGKIGRKSGPVEDEFQKEEEDEARELRQLRIDEIKARRRARIAKAERDEEINNPSSGKDLSNIVGTLLKDPETQRQWLDLTPEERAIILSSIREANAGDSLANSQLRLLMAQTRTNPQSTTKELAELLNLIQGRGKEVSVLEAIRVGAELASNKESKGKGETSTLVEFFATFIKPLYDALNSRDREYLQKEIEELKRQPQFAEQLTYFKTVAGELGMRPASVAGQESMEATKMQLDHERWKVEEEWKHETFRDEMKLKVMSEEKRWDTMSNIATKFLEKAGPLIDAMVGAGQKKLAGNEDDSSNQPPIIPCPNCGAVLAVPENMPDEIACPKCKAVLTRKPDAKGEETAT